MGQQVVLTVPDEVYRQAQAVARRTQQTVESVLVQALEENLPLFPVHPQREEMLQQERLFEARREALLDRYPGRFVAVRDGQVLDSDAVELALMERVRAQYPDQLVLVRQVTPDPLPSLNFRSPRFVSDS